MYKMQTTFCGKRISSILGVLPEQEFFFEECALNCNNKIVLNWFLHVFKEKGKGSQIIFKMYNEDKKELEICF